MDHIFQNTSALWELSPAENPGPAVDTEHRGSRLFLSTVAALPTPASSFFFFFFPSFLFSLRSLCVANRICVYLSTKLEHAYCKGNLSQLSLFRT